MFGASLNSLTHSHIGYPVCGMVHIKETLLLIAITHVAAVGFLSLYLNGPLPYVQRHITVYKINVLSASLNKIFPSFILKNVISFYYKIFKKIIKKCLI